MKKPEKKILPEMIAIGEITDAVYDRGFNEGLAEGLAYHDYVHGRLPDEKEIENIISSTCGSQLAKAIHDRLRGR